MRIDGEQLTEQLQRKLAQRVALKGAPRPKLAIVHAGQQETSMRFVARKHHMGEMIGASVEEVSLSSETSQAEMIEEIKALGENDAYHGVIVQLPLPAHMEVQEVLNTVPLAKDIDMLSDAAREAFRKNETSLVPPVAGAISHVLQYYHISVSGKHVVIVGHGRLVGQPVEAWLVREGVTPTVIDKDTSHACEAMQEADILITGVGKPGLVTPECIQEGAVVLDAGTATQAGNLQGDVDPACHKKCTLFTPVPGGLGPLTVANVFENLVTTWEYSH